VVPPFVGIAVNVTLVPEQIAPTGTAAILTLTGKFGFTVIVIPALVAVVGLAQVAFDVNIQVTIWPFAKVAFVYVVLFVPAFTPFTCH